MITRYLLLSSLLVVLMVSAQTAVAQNRGEVSMRFVSFPKSTEPVKVKLWIAENNYLEIEAPTNWLSKPKKVPSLGSWTVGETTEGPDGKSVFTELGRTKALTTPDQILLLVRKGKNNADGFDLIALDARTNGFGAGKYLFLNAAKVDVAGVIGEEKFLVKPAQHTMIQPKIPAGQHTVHAALYFRKGDEARPFFSSEWRISDDSRNMIFFYHDPNTTHIRMHAIKDYIPR